MGRDRHDAARLHWLLALLAAFTSSVSSAAQPRLAPEVAFFSTALPELLASYRTLVDAMEFCNRTPAAACRERHAIPAPVLADMQYFLDRITIFPTVSNPPSRGRQQKLKAPESAEAEIEAMRLEYEEKLQEFDTEFLGHYGALLHVCGKTLEGADRSRFRYQVVREVTFDRFWGKSPRESREALGVVDGIASDAIRQLDVVAKERCTAMLDLSKTLLGVLVHRLKPYSKRDCCDVSRADRWGGNLSFTWSIALELEARMRPDVLKEVDAREALSNKQTQQQHPNSM
jgi:hypothetical protein